MMLLGCCLQIGKVGGLPGHPAICDTARPHTIFDRSGKCPKLGELGKSVGGGCCNDKEMTQRNDKSQHPRC